MIGLEDIAGIKSAEEGKAVALAIYNQLPRWIEITDDEKTLPPVDEWVTMIYHDTSYVASRQREGNYLVCMPNSFITVMTDRRATHWRPI